MGTPRYDVIVIGGGASGLMAAGRAAEQGKSVLLLEKNTELGKKLSITGGGRCNITNAEEDEHVLLRAYGVANKYLYSAFQQFGMQDAIRFFTDKGLSIKVEERKRAFPVTEKASDVVGVLQTYLQKYQVKVHTSEAVTAILSENNLITGIKTAKATYTATHYIFATGSVSRPETGSTGDGFNWLRQLGHTVKSPTPTIVPLKTRQKWSKNGAGTSLRGVYVTAYVDGVKQFRLSGDVLLTHFGISGPLILNNAGRFAELLTYGDVSISIDAYPKLDSGALDTHLVRIFDEHKNKSLKNILKRISPEGTQRAIGSLLQGHMDIETKVHSISREQRKKIGQLLKALPLTVEGLMGYDRAVIADGGIVLDEIDMRTMRSKKIANLSVTGDLLHINRPSGGYSLQLCWTTGFVAGSHC